MITTGRAGAMWMLALLLLLGVYGVGCKGFWDPANAGFSLSNSGTISISTPGATSGNTSTITVTPTSFSGTVALTCAVSTSPTNATSPVTCSLSPTSVSVSGSTAETATLTATTTSTTTTGAYEITVTGTSGSASATTTACVVVGSSSGNCTSSNTSGKFFVLNGSTNQLAGFYVNAGVLTSLSGSPYTVPGTPLSLAIAPNGNFLYVGTSLGVYVYTISSSGQVTLGNSKTPITADQAISMQVSPDNNWLIEVASGAPYVYAIPISSSNGVATSKTEQYAALPVGTVQQVAVSPDESYVFAAMGSGGTAAIPFNGSNVNPLGNVTRIATVSTSGSALSVAVDPESSPRLFYIGETAATSGSNSGGLRAFTFSSLGGTLKEVSGSPFAIAGLAPYDILPTADGSYVYVVNRQVSGSSTGVIAGFSVASSSLTALGSTFSVGTNPVALAEDSTGTYIFAVDYGGSPDLKGYTFDSSNAGYLDAAISGATGTDPVKASAIAAMP